MDFIKRHALLLGFISFILISLPQGISAWVQLADRYSETQMPSLNLSILSWIAPLLGFMLFLIVFWQIKPKRQAGPVDRSQEFRDVLDHVSVEGHDLAGLVYMEGVNGKPYNYPIMVRNSRPLPVDIVGYDVTILLNGNPFQTITWRPPSPTTSNGYRVVPPWEATSSQDIIRLSGDVRTTLPILVNHRQFVNMPVNTPEWGAKGNLLLDCFGQRRTIGFDLSSDNYRLPQNDWSGRVLSGGAFDE